MTDLSDAKAPCCTPKLARPKLAAEAPKGLGADPRWKVRLVDVPGGRASVGTDSPFIPFDGEGPRRSVVLKPFRIDSYPVTNAWFSEFISDTGYRTEAERFGWSLVFWSFAEPDGTYQRVAAAPWWCRVDGADWAHPHGPQSSIERLDDHPVTQVSWNDAAAFAKWAGGRLPTEAEWEHAARGGLENPTFPWGDTEPTDDAPLCNIWQGKFPDLNTCVDGYEGTAPVHSFVANGYGLYNMAGNVWEWTNDTFRIRSNAKLVKLRNAEAVKQNTRLAKGGSFLCHKSYCFRYRIAARIGVTADSGTSHMGFRVVV